MRRIILLALALVAVALSVSTADAKAVVNYPADCDYICMNEYYGNMDMSLPDSGDDLDTFFYAWDGTIRCWHATKYSGRGFSYEARRYSLYVRWCSRNYSTIREWSFGLSSTTGSSCHLSSYDTPYIYGGGINTSAIYVTSRAHFACDVGFPYSPITVYPDCWLNVRYGAAGVSSVQARGCDWV